MTSYLILRLLLGGKEHALLACEDVVAGSSFESLFALRAYG